jgi:hypothetical protein
MSIQTVFAHVSCCNIAISAPWYEKLFDKKARSTPHDGIGGMAV